MRKSILSVVAAGVAAILVSGQAEASSLIPVGTATGGMMIHYNNIDNSGAGGIGHPDGVISGYDENPANIAYIQSQFSLSNTNGASFAFAPPLDALEGQVSPTQFGFDLVYQAPTYSNAGGVVPATLNFKDNVDNNIAHATTTTGGTTAFAIDDYKGAAPNGPANPSTSVINSLIRGTSATFNVDSITLTGSVYTLIISGTLVTDGSVHWYTPGFPDTSLASLGLSNVLTYSGTLTYDKAGDNGSTQTDFYTGSVDIFATAVPLPSVSWLGVALIGGLVAKRSMTARRA